MAYSKEERRHRNRQAAKLSRERQRSAFSTLQVRVAELEAENARLRAGRTPVHRPARVRTIVAHSPHSGPAELPPWYIPPEHSSPYDDPVDLPSTPPTGPRSHAFATPPPDALHEALFHTSRSGGISNQMRMLRIPSTDSASTSSSVDEPASLSEDSPMEGEPEVVSPERDVSLGPLSVLPDHTASTPDSSSKLTLRIKRLPRTFSSRLASVHAQLADMNQIIIELAEDYEGSACSDDDVASDDEAEYVSADDPGWSEEPLPPLYTSALHPRAPDDPDVHLRPLRDKLIPNSEGSYSGNVTPAGLTDLSWV